MKPEIQENIIALMLAGTPAAIFRYRGQSIEEIKYVDKKTGKQESFHKHVLACEYENGRQVNVEIDYARGDLPQPVDFDKDDPFYASVVQMIRGSDSTNVRVNRNLVPIN